VSAPTTVRPVLEPGDSPEHPLAPYFESMRRERRRRQAVHARSRPPRRRAIITIVHNEPLFFPLWLAYYGKFFAPQDMYVLDNDSDDGSTERDGFVRIPVAHDGLDNLWMVGQVQTLQRQLLEHYEVVVVTDVDEIVAPSPQRGTLGEYLDHFDEEWVNCLGYEVIHGNDVEPPLRLDRPILRQRGYWFMTAYYDKPAVATAPLTWRPGFHGRADYALNPDPDLRMIHLHRVDYEICKARHRERVRGGWAELDAHEGWGGHNFIVDEPEFHRWFHLEDERAHPLLKVEPIPECWKDIL
jgi:hypothetical protein